MGLRTAALCVLPILTVGAVSALADAIPYPNFGVPGSAVTLTAASTGPVQGYFAGQSAVDLDTVALLDLTSGQTSSYFFPNHTTTPGVTANFGTVAAGDQLVFLLFNEATQTTLQSDATNADGLAHAYVTNFPGGGLQGNIFPAGVYVGFEDLLASQGSDFDYNDNTFVFTNVLASTSAVPEPGSLALLGTGALGAVAMLRRRISRG